MSLRLYSWLRTFLRLVTGVFFRQVEVVGLEHVPEHGPVIFAGNHPNSLIDPLLIVVSCGRVVRFAAKDVLFRSPFLRPVLRALGAVPIARRSDHADIQPGTLRGFPDPPAQDSARQAELHPREGSVAAINVVAFDTLIEVLAGGGTIGIFPEGLSHDAPQLARLKTGAARIAAGVCQRHPEQAVAIVPCGLTYMQRRRFRSRVLLQFGTPLIVDAVRAGAEDVVASVTAELDAGLRALTVNAADWDTLRVLDGFRRLYQPPQISIHDRVELARRFNAEYPRVRDEPEVQALYARVAAYLDRLDAARVSDRDLRRTLSRADALARIARHLLLIVVWLPLALPGAILHAPAGLLVQVAAPVLTPRKDVLAATKLLAGLLLVMASYAAGIAWLGVRAGAGAALLALVALPITGYATLQVFDRSGSLRRGLSTLARLLSFEREIAALRAERTELEAAVVAAVNRFRPADMVLLFPRESEPGRK